MSNIFHLTPCVSVFHGSSPPVAASTARPAT